jgi:hypothetical protein
VSDEQQNGARALKYAKYALITILIAFITWFAIQYLGIVDMLIDVGG